jgi:hypothetical protein
MDRRRWLQHERSRLGQIIDENLPQHQTTSVSRMRRYGKTGSVTHGPPKFPITQTSQAFPEAVWTFIDWAEYLISSTAVSGPNHLQNCSTGNGDQTSVAGPSLLPVPRLYRRFAAGLTGTNRGASEPQSQCPSHLTAWLLLIDARFPWRQVKSRNVGFMGTRDVGEEEVCRFEAVRQRVGDRT